MKYTKSIRVDQSERDETIQSIHKPHLIEMKKCIYLYLARISRIGDNSKMKLHFIHANLAMDQLSCERRIG